jgi:hypothetical protein
VCVRCIPSGQFGWVVDRDGADRQRRETCQDRQDERNLFLLYVALVRGPVDPCCGERLGRAGPSVPETAQVGGTSAFISTASRRRLIWAPSFNPSLGRNPMPPWHVRARYSGAERNAYLAACGSGVTTRRWRWRWRCTTLADLVGQHLSRN